MTAVADIFEGCRPQLRGLAYRMLGSRADADDVVQDAWLRWQGTDLTEVEFAGSREGGRKLWLELDNVTFY